MHVIGYTLHGPASITGYMHLPNLSPLFMHVCITSYTCYYQKKKKKTSYTCELGQKLFNYKLFKRFELVKCLTHTHTHTNI